MAEQAAWKFVEDNKTTFDLTVINQDIVIGPMLHPVTSSRNINETNRFAIYNFVDETQKLSSLSGSHIIICMHPLSYL